MKEVERNKRLMLLLNKLISEKDFDSIELIKTFVNKDSEAIQFSFKLMTEKNPNFNKKEEK